MRVKKHDIVWYQEKKCPCILPNTANKILRQPTLVAMAINLRQKVYDLDSVRDISMIFASNGRFSGTGY